MTPVRWWIRWAFLAVMGALAVAAGWLAGFGLAIVLRLVGWPI